MISFQALPSLTRSVFALWALALCIANIACGVHAASKKRYALMLPAAVLFIPVYLIWQMIFDISLFSGTESLTEVSRFAGELDLWVWLVVFSALAAASGVLIGYNIHFGRTAVTPGAIKLFLDKIPCGVCCYRDNGRVLFSNICINDICLSLTGAPLLNGNHFREAASGGIKNVSGKVWRFSFRDIVLQGETLHEITATDITDEYAHTRQLEKDRAELAQLNNELSEYYLSIDESVRHREILQAKINIHDEMNGLMLLTSATKSTDTEEIDRIFSLWARNALLLCREAAEVSGVRDIPDIRDLASALKLNVSWQEPVPEALSGEQRKLIFSAAGEAVINAVKHAGATDMSVNFEEDDLYYYCRFSNNGRLPKGDVHFTGGLANLARLAEKQGASVSVSSDKTFVLSLSIPKTR